MSELQTMNYKVVISESNGKVSIEIEIDGTPYVPVSLEMSFRPGGELVGVLPDKKLADSYFLESRCFSFMAYRGDRSLYIPFAKVLFRKKPPCPERYRCRGRW